MEEKQNTQLQENQVVDTSLNNDERQFALLQREAKLLSQCDFIPNHFKRSIPNCFIAINMARQLKVNITTVVQNLYIVNEVAGWKSTFLIACINKTKKFTVLKYKFEGEGDDRSCVAYANELLTGEIVKSPPVSIKMAKAEGWYNRNGTKWKAMPDTMMSYRAATFFARLFAPEITLGFETADELEDIGKIKHAEKFSDNSPKTLKALTNDN